MDIEWIKDKVRENRYLWSLHAEEERRNDGLEIDEVEQALLNGEVIETYPQDPRGASCLVCGKSQGVPIHIVCGENNQDWLVLITVYKPSTSKWKTPMERRKK